jgi:glycosyltransferase involved in cell wall biosynthesis
LRIVHAVRSDAFAGVERYVTSTAHELVRRGHEVTVIGGERRRVREASHLGGFNFLPAESVATVAMRLVSAGRHADVLHVHMTAAEAAAALASPVVRRPIVATRHFAGPRGRSALGRLVAPLIGRSVDRQLAISRFVADRIRERAEVLLNGVPSTEVSPEVDAKVTLVVQRLEPEKRTEDAIRAWCASQLATLGWQLWIVGDGSERARLEHEARAVDGVRFLGQVADVNALRAMAAVQLAPAHEDGYGLSVVEAMATGMPVIAAAGGGHVETVGLVRPDLLYTPGDVVECAGLLCRVAQDRQLRERAGAELRAFQRAALSVEAHAEKLESIYLDLLGRW